MLVILESFIHTLVEEDFLSNFISFEVFIPLIITYPKLELLDCFSTLISFRFIGFSEKFQSNLTISLSLLNILTTCFSDKFVDSFRELLEVFILKFRFFMFTSEYSPITPSF